MLKNLFAALPADVSHEAFEDLLDVPGLRIERIVSYGQRSAPGFWYTQDHDEWVIVLRGHATLRVDPSSATQGRQDASDGHPASPLHPARQSHEARQPHDASEPDNSLQPRDPSEAKAVRQPHDVVARHTALIMLAAGDHYWIPAGLRHRVDSTATDGPTIWLAVHR